MVRTKDGRGTGDVDLPSNSTTDDILEYAVGTFFEGGSSKFGAEQTMEFDLSNFKCENVSDVTNKDGSTVVVIICFLDQFTLQNLCHNSCHFVPPSTQSISYHFPPVIKKKKNLDVLNFDLSQD